jgi:hypothetical protein
MRCASAMEANLHTLLEGFFMARFPSTRGDEARRRGLLQVGNYVR